jgi:hypothetical protein
MSAANPNPMEKSIVSVLVVANTGGGSPLLYHVFLETIPMGNTMEVLDAELCTIHDCLTTCQKTIEYNHLHGRHINIFTNNQATILHTSRMTYFLG